MEEIFNEILSEIKKIRFVLQERRETKSGGAFPPNPEVQLHRTEDGKERGVVPEGAKWVPCSRDCGVQVVWVKTQFGNRPLEKDGQKHDCPNYRPQGSFSQPALDDVPQQTHFDANAEDVPF